MSDDTPSNVEDALADAEASAAAVQAELSGGPAPAGGADKPGGATGIEMLGDVELDVRIELGRTEMLVEEVLQLGSGSVVELDKLAGDPVDVFVNGRKVARGEVLVLNDNFCIRVSEVVADLEAEVLEEA